MIRNSGRVVAIAIFAGAVVIMVVGAAIINSSASNSKLQPTMAERMIINSDDLVGAHWEYSNKPNLSQEQSSYEITAFSYGDDLFNVGVIVWESSSSCLADYQYNRGFRENSSASGLGARPENVSIGDQGYFIMTFELFGHQIGEIIFIQEYVEVFVDITAGGSNLDHNYSREAASAVAEIQDLKIASVLSP
jgi:hypothetical protein